MGDSRLYKVKLPRDKEELRRDIEDRRFVADKYQHMWLVTDDPKKILDTFPNVNELKCYGGVKTL